MMNMDSTDLIIINNTSTEQQQKNNNNNYEIYIWNNFKIGTTILDYMSSFNENI